MERKLSDLWNAAKVTLGGNLEQHDFFFNKKKKSQISDT